MKMKRYAVIGAGISGLSVARMLVEKGEQVVVFEKESAPGGLIRCEWVEGTLYHRVGGHVFNSRNPEVLQWFWEHVNKEDFLHAKRHAVVNMPDGSMVDYPIENHLYQMREELREAVLDDLLEMLVAPEPDDDNFDDFLQHRFGKTLYRAYFAPYNRKIWRCSLTQVPLAWLEGKLPMPTVREILAANIGQKKEMNMVHSTFHYPKHNGSQHIADTLAAGLDLRLNTPVREIRKDDDTWLVNEEAFTHVIYCANIKQLPPLLAGVSANLSEVDRLDAHGTTSVLCAIDKNPYSWVYMPNVAHESHRVICTGNFSPNNSPHHLPEGTSTATIEFTLQLSKEEILEQLQRIPFAPRYLSHCYTPYTYPLQKGETRGIIKRAKQQLAPHRLYLLGRFAEWEYYNMDAAIEAAMKLLKTLHD